MLTVLSVLKKKRKKEPCRWRGASEPITTLQREETERFSKADKNMDGKLSAEEYKTIIAEDVAGRVRKRLQEREGGKGRPGGNTAQTQPQSVRSGDYVDVCSTVCYGYLWICDCCLLLVFVRVLANPVPGARCLECRWRMGGMAMASGSPLLR